MTVHKLTAGDGYTYLTRQVAANDATNRGYDNLGAYYEAKGEAPGVWMGSGLATVPNFHPQDGVTEAQMVALFGEGRHPNAVEIERAALAAGQNPWQVKQSSMLGSPYRIHEQANMFNRRSAGAYRDYNTALGLHADTPVPAEERSRMRTELAAQMFAETFGRPPADARELSGHLARISRQATTAVAGYDLSFSPVKSVSTLWAVAPRDVAQVIEQAHHDAVKDTVTWLEDNAAYTRRGKNGVAQVDVHGLIAAAFTHRDSRAGDPDLHTHVAISNKVQTLDGKWLALDGRPIFKNGVAASERYNTRLEALLIERLGVQFADRTGDDPSKRPVREILGVDGPLPRHWSSRRAAIDVRRAVLSATFQADHGRPPTPQEAIALAGRANKETRQAKHEPRSYAEQRATWRTEAVAVLGGETGLRDYVRGALEPIRGTGHTRREAQRLSPAWVDHTAGKVLTIVQGGRATWQANHVRAEAERQARSAGVRLGDLDRAVDAVVTAALAPGRSLPLGHTADDEPAAADPVGVPAKLRRRDGSSVYTVAGSRIYTSAQIIAAEEAIVAAAARRDGRAVTAETVDMALLESTANGVELNPGQVQMVRELATSGARVQLALAPAGTGKTTAMRVLSRAWTSTQFDGAAGGNVVGLAPSAAAAAVLREEIGTDTDTLAKLIHALETGVSVPEWVTTIGPHTLVVIDEAGMAGTTDLAKAIGYVTDRGGSVRLVGDDQQLAAIGAGGVLRDVATTHGAVTLSQVMRFTHPDTGAPNHAEGAASLALRDGETAAIAYYIDNGRVHVGDITTVTDDAYGAWSADRSAGRDAIMLAPTRDLVAELNDRARRDRLDVADAPPGGEVRLVDGSHASAGDAIITRKNNRKLAVTATDWVKNGDRWHIDGVRDSGALDVTHLRTGRHITLPADYVAENVSLGYASTVHGAQGITADASYTVATGDESRQLLYVAMTRGRHSNHVFLTTAGDGDEHSVITRDALLPPTAGDILARVLIRDGAPVSATSAQRAATDLATRLGAVADQYYDALGFAAADHLGPERMAAIDTAADTVLPGLTQFEAYPALRSHLALMAVDDHDPATVLRHAITAGQQNGRGLDDARDAAAVLDWRLDPTGHRSTGTGPLPWLPAVPSTLRTSPEWGRYLVHNAGTVAATAAAVAEQARAWTPTSAPHWATPIIDRDRDLVAELAVWRAANNVDDADRRSTGPTLPAAADARAQRALDERVSRMLGDPKTATGRWTALAHSVDERITTDSYWPTLADRLTVADRAGIDITNLVRAVGAESPLPDEQPAAALWWRLSRHLTPAAMTATDHSVSETLRPNWTPKLADIVGQLPADRITADPAWPALVAAVTHAGRDGWEPEQLLTTAHDLLRGGQPDDEPLRPDELATALVWRIGMLTDTAPAAPEDYLQPEAGDPPQPVADADLDLLGSPDVDLDDDWLASLVEPDIDTIGADEDQTPELGSASPNHTPGSATDRSASGETDRDDTVDWVSVLNYPTDDQINAVLDRAADQADLPADPWATAAVPRARIVELNAQAGEFFTARYPDSWAPDYLTDRLGTDLSDDDRFTVGYAPDSWTALTTHLRRRGATDEEIVGAGLGSYASTGRVIDRFRDRLVVPIRATGPEGDTEIHGFIARRNPAKTDDQNAGPKYLNTSDTGLFTKGHELYGLVENADALAAGATPVLVEGPMDALAVTLAGDGAYVGVAPLGTAFTDTQADTLRPYLGTDRPGVIVATDADRAGQQAAHRAFWQLTARGDTPRHLLVAGGKDPAELLQTDGPDALKSGLDAAEPLADTVIAARIAPWADRLDTVEGSVYAARAAAQVVAALPASTWPEYLSGIVATTDVEHQTAIEELFDAHTVWSDNPHAAAKRHLAERLPDPPSTTTGAATPPTPPAPVSASQRWAALADSLVPDLSADVGWPALAASLDRAERTGFDVGAQLPALIANRPLPEDHVARSLELRLANAHPESIAPLSDATRRAAQRDADAATRSHLTDVDTASLGRSPTRTTPLSAPGPAGPATDSSLVPQRPPPAPEQRRSPNR